MSSKRPESQNREGRFLETASRRAFFLEAQHSREQLITILESITDGFACLDDQWNIIYVNQAAQKLIGKPASELLGKNHWQEFPAALGTLVEREYRRAVAERVTVEFEHYYTGWDRWFEIKAFPAVPHGLSIYFRDISKRKQTEEALRKNEERFRLAAHSAAITLYEQDADLRYTWLYPDHAEHQGALGKTDGEILGNDGAEVMSWKRDTMATGTAQRRIVRAPLPTGVRYYDLFISPRRDPAGNVVGVAGASLDVTDRKRADHASFQLAAIVESSDDAILAKDLNGIIRSWNKGAERIFGYKPEEVIGKSITILIPVERLGEEPIILERIRRGERVDHFETVRRHKDGTLLDISVTVSPVKDADGHLIGASKIARDITEYKRNRDQRQALFELVEVANRAKSLTELFDAALAAIGGSSRADRSAILLYDSDGVMRFKAWRGLSDGYRAAVEGHSPWQPDDPDPQPVCINDVSRVPLEDHLRQVIAREGIGALAFIPIRYERQLLGKFMIYYNRPHAFNQEQIEPAQTMATQVAFGIQRQKRAEALEHLVSQRTASLREAVQQMEEFSYTVSHDLRAPLRGMQVYSQAVLEDYSQALPDEAKRYLRRVTENAARLDKMVLDLLTFSRVARAEVQLQPVSIGRLVRDVIDHYPALHAPEAKIHVEPLLDVVGHEPSLTQIISNLLINAVKFKKPGAVPIVRVHTEERGTTVRLWIEDNGIGIDPRYQHRLFNMFERIHRDLAFDGTGVGLAIVRKAAERMGGKVGVESDGVNGSRFWIDLQRPPTAP